MKKELAGKLALNHITNSLLRDDDEVIKEVIEKKNWKDFLDYRKDSRYILIVGAGASFSASNKIHLANAAATEIRNYLAAKYPDSFEILINGELDRLTQVYKLEREDFETQLFAYSKFFKTDVLKKLKEFYNKKYEVSLFYEIIGHMLKHRFIDVVINYNFDELLDNVIEEELGTAKFSNIISDGDCPNDYKTELLHKEKSFLISPVYIKPHGTISHPSTLRFTRESYFDISNEISNLISNLISGKDHRERPKHEINLIVVGFGMNSFELNEILRKTHSEKNKLNVYVIDWKTKEEFKDSLDSDLKICFNINYFQVNENLSIDDYFEDLWDVSYDLFVNGYKPKGIGRHRFISTLFSNRKLSFNGFMDREKEYFLYRVYAEISLAILTSDGLLNSTQIRNSRVSKYYRLYREYDDEFSLSFLLSKLSLELYKDYVKDTYLLGAENFKHMDTLMICTFVYSNLLHELSASLSEREGIIQRLKAKKEDIIYIYFRELKSRNLLNVKYDECILYESQFDLLKPVNIIRNDLDWSFRFKNSVQKYDWHLMLSISEFGRFLFQKENQSWFENRCAEVIVSSYDIDSIDREFTDIDGFNLLSKNPLKLPWWSHNQHIVIFLKQLKRTKKDSIHGFKLQIGYYFSSRLLNRIVTPLEIKDPANLLTLLDIFTTYWITSKHYVKNKNLRYPKSLEEIEIARKTLLTEAKTLLNRR